MREEIKSFIYENGMAVTAKHFGLTPFKVRQHVQWTYQDHKDWLARRRLKLLEARKRNKYAKELERRSKPEIRARMRLLDKQHRQRHTFKNLADQSNYSRHKPKDKLTAQHLFSIAKEQKLICPYTGLKLTKQTMSVEHVVPLSKGGTNTRDNIRLVHVWANRMKLDHTLAEFKTMVKLLAATLLLTADSTQP